MPHPAIIDASLRKYGRVDGGSERYILAILGVAFIRDPAGFGGVMFARAAGV